MANKIKKSQVLRHAIQLIMFFALPGIYAMTFSQAKTFYKMIINGNFDFIQVFPSLMEFISVMIVIILMGRWFCGWICAFGAYNDLIYFISKKIFRGKFKVDEKVDSILKYTKYVILLFIIILSWTFGSSILQSTSPWDVFGQITNIASIVSNLLIGLILLVLITIGAAFVERFFCRYLCPLGAIFAILSKIGIVKINKPKADCGKCRACTINCSMGLELYKLDCAKGGNCINCLKCTEVCPRKNANINILGKDLNQSLAGSVAMAVMLGVYGITNFGVHALTKTGIISNNNDISSEALQDSASDNSSKKYKDGTYTGSGHGFGGTIKISVTIEDGKIADIKTLSNEDSVDYYNRAFETISKEIISNQATQVDTVSGATYSSKGIISAVREALNQAVVSLSDIDTYSDGNDNEDENTALYSQENEQNSATESNAISDSDNSPKSYKDGTYVGSGQGYAGKTRISVTIANGKIVSVQTLSNEDTPEFYDRASNSIISRIISAQSANVDTVSGATISSRGIISAVRDALNQAVVSPSDIETTSDNNKNKDENAVLNSQENEQNSAVESNAISNSDNSPKSYKDGTYTGSGRGFGGVTKISVTVVNGKITSVQTLSNEDTSEYYEKASNSIISRMISGQSANVDTVSGATLSSNGIISAVRYALSQAGGSNSNSSTSASAVNQESSSSNSAPSQGSTSSSQYKDGTYTGIGQGYAGKTKISVTIANGKITSVKTISNEDMPMYYDRAIGIITNSVISKQSALVDTVSGATYSSKGIIEAVKNALNQAKQ